MPSLRNIALAIALLFYPLNAVYNRLVVLGAFRSHPPPSITSTSPSHILETRLITGIQQGEDFAYHEPSGLLLFTAPGNRSSRYGWWPPVLTVRRPEDALFADGGIWALDTATWSTKRIAIEGFTGPLIPHGLDIYSPPNHADTIYLHAVNHKPASHGPHKFNSTVEIFRITLSSFTATHVQTVHHPLIVTPNDIYSLGESEFLVTNDHVNRDAGLSRVAEELFTWQLASRTNIVRVDASIGRDVQAEVVKTGIHSANGLGHGPNGEIILNDASGGVLHTLSPDLTTTSSVKFPNTVDNPTYFSDPFASPSSDMSGYVVAGLHQGIKLAEHVLDPEAHAPSVVWLARKSAAGKWEKMKLLEDDGVWLNAGTTAAVFPIDPKTTAGRREAWVVATGFLSSGVGLARVDLTDWAAV